MLTNKELDALSGKTCPHETYDNYRNEFNIPHTAKPVPRGFLESPGAVEHDALEAADEYLILNPGANRYAYAFGYLIMQYVSIHTKYQALLTKTTALPKPNPTLSNSDSQPSE